MEFQKIVYIIFLCIVSGNSIKYDNVSLFMGTSYTKKELDFYETLRDEYNVLYWQKPGRLYSTVEFSIRPTELETFLSDVSTQKIHLNVVTKNLQRAFEKIKIRNYNKTKLSTFDWKGYYRLEDIYRWYEDLQQENPQVVSLVKIGSTLEQRLIMAIKLKFEQVKTRPKVIIEGGIHAREWISPAFVTYMINVLVNANSSNSRILQEMAYAYEWIFVPVLNPDGYEYSQAEDRLWNKNRRHGHGVDLNKNFDIAFGTVGADHQRFGDSYCGERQFSEPESHAMGDLITANRRNLEYYIAFHSFGQNIIIPYDHMEENEGNYRHVIRLGEKVVQQIRRRYQSKYLVGTMYELKGTAAYQSWALSR